MPSLSQIIKDLQAQIDELSAPQSSMLGPGRISSNFIRSKSITSTLLSVSELEAVSASTGDLSVTGNITMATAGSIRAGLTDFSTDLTHTGYWLGSPAGTPKLLIGGRVTSTTPRLEWDGSALTVLGAVKAESGYLKDLAISGTLTLGSGGKLIDGDGSYWDQNGITLAAPGSIGDVVRFVRSGYTPVSTIQSYATTGESGLTFASASGGDSRKGEISVFSVDGDDVNTGVVLRGVKGDGSTGGLYSLGAEGSHTWIAAAFQMSLGSDGHLLLPGRVYPGGATRYIGDNSSAIVVMGSGGLYVDDVTQLHGSAQADAGFTVAGGTLAANADVVLAGAGSKVGFYGSAGAVKQTGVAVDAIGIHAALVAYGLISA